MNKVFSITLVSLAMIACASDDDKAVDFAQATTEKTTKLDNGDNSPQCCVKISVDYAKTGDSKIDDAINNAVERELFGFEGIDMKAAADSFANQYSADYRKSLATLYKADKADESKKPWYEYKYEVTTETKSGRKGLTVYTANIEYYEGGAHGVSLLTAMNFDNATGRRLSLGDIFVPGHEKRLNEILFKALEEKTGKHGIDELKAEGYLCNTDIYAPQNFILDSDGMTFIYNAYEIAPYDKGRTELTIDYDDMEDLLAKDK